MRKEILEATSPVKGYDGYSVTADGTVFNRHGKALNPFLDKCGYYTVSLCKNGCSKKFFVHRLVASAFLDNTENRETVNHKNGIKTDNRVENLEWCTIGENIIHAYKTGLQQPHGCKGEQNGRAVVSNEQVKLIRERLHAGAKGIYISKEYHISRSAVSQIKNKNSFINV